MRQFAPFTFLFVREDVARLKSRQCKESKNRDADRFDDWTPPGSEHLRSEGTCLPVVEYRIVLQDNQPWILLQSEIVWLSADGFSTSRVNDPPWRIFDPTRTFGNDDAPVFVMPADFAEGITS